MAGLNDIREPIEVYEAAEGDPSALIEFLRGDEPINDWMRQALAEWLAGDLPAKYPRGRLRMDPIERLRLRYAWEMYSALKKKEIKIPPELGRNGLRSEDLMVIAAEVHGLDSEKFLNFMRRSLRHRREAISLRDFEGHRHRHYLEWKKNRKK